MIRIDRLQKKLKEINKEIDKYQNSCSHSRQHIQALENNDIRLVCDACNKDLGWPNYDELQKWLRK